MEENSKILKKFFIGLAVGFLAIFLGSFLAFYLIFHQLSNNMQVSYFNRELNTPFNSPFFERNINRDFNNLIRDTRNIPLNFPMQPIVSVRSEDNRDNYKLLFNLKSFGNNAQNVDIKADGNRLTISAKYENKEKNKFFNSSSFYQSIMLPKKIDISKIKKEQKGDTLIITIPKS